MSRMDKKWIIGGLILAIFFLGGGLWLGRVFFVRNTDVPEKFVTIGRQRIKTELVSTPQTRELGLSGRDALCAECGMLFVFEKKDVYPFWMKDMKFDLDMLWISGNKIVQIDKNVPFAGGTEIIRSPRVPVDKVLELNAGASDRLHIKEGNEIKF